MTSSIVSSENFKSSSSDTVSLIFHSITGAAMTKLTDSKTQFEISRLMYSTLSPSSRHITAAPADWIPLGSLLVTIIN